MVFPVVFVNNERAYVDFVLSKSKKKKVMLYQRIEACYADPNAATCLSYAKVLKEIRENEDRLVNIHKISSFVIVLDMVFENFPQAVVMISFLFVSLEHELIRNILANNLNNLFVDYGFVFTIFSITTVFTLVFSIMNFR